MNFPSLRELFEERSLAFDVTDLELPAKKMGTSDGYYIWGSRYDDNLDAYGILENDIPIAVLYIENKESMIDGKKCQEIAKIWVHKDHRLKGLAISLLSFVIRKMQTVLSSGKLISDDGELLYKKIIANKTFDVEIVVNGRLTHLIPDDLWKLPNSYQIILDKKDLSSQDHQMFEGKLKHHRLYRKQDGTSDWD